MKAAVKLLRPAQAAALLVVAGALLLSGLPACARPQSEGPALLSQAAGVADMRWGDPSADPARIDSLLQAAPAGLGMAAYTARFADAFLGTPYGAGTLEVAPERLTVRLDSLDCTTYVETVLALARTASRGRPTALRFAPELRSVRYRGANDPDGNYAARLHYMSDWIVENAGRGLFTDITPDLPGASTVTKSLDYMSAHRDAYPALADDATLRRIRSVEGAYRNHRYPIVATSRVSAATLKALRDGDIVVFLTKKEGLDASHVGFVRVDPADGTVRLQHASSKAGRVVVDPLPLADYLRRNRSLAGIRVLRPKD